jgi:uncharacterized SAM-binding protein YcdF (DUF218 family)
MWRILSITAVALSIVSLFLANAGRILVLNSPQRSDVILVLAGETDHRPALALKLLEQGYASRVIFDVPAGVRVYGADELDLAQKYTQSSHRAAALDICPIIGLSTKTEAHDAEKCLNRDGGERVLIVTSDFHTRRALSVFRHELRGKTFSIAASYDDVQFGTNWWRRRQWAKTCLEEWMRLSWWMSVDRWR